MLWNVKIKYQGSTDYNEEIVFTNEPLKLDTKNIVSSIVYRITYKYENEALPPHLITLNGKKYIVPIWKEVHPQTTIDDIIWIKPKPKAQVEKKVFKFESASEKGMFYQVKVEGTKISCNCPGVWRAKDRACKHMKQVKQELGV